MDQTHVSPRRNFVYVTAITWRRESSTFSDEAGLTGTFLAPVVFCSKVLRTKSRHAVGSLATKEVNGYSGPAFHPRLRFAELSGVRPMIETYPLEKAGEAYARMMSGNAQFRVVLTM